MTKVDTLKLCQDRLADMQEEVVRYAAANEYFMQALNDPKTRSSLYEGSDDATTEEVHALLAEPLYICGFIVGMMAAADEADDEHQHEMASGFFLAASVLSDIHVQATGTKIPSVG